MSADTLQLTRFFKVPPAQVFDALTQPAQLMRWFGPRGCTCPAVALDVRVGGRYRVEMHGDDSGNVMVLAGEYREIVPAQKLVFTWVWAQGAMAGVETLVSITLKPKPGGTEVTVQHAGLPSGYEVEMHAKGWSSSWDCLDDHLADKPKVPIARPLLLGDPRSTYTRSARMGFEEKGIAYRLEPRGITYCST